MERELKFQYVFQHPEKKDIIKKTLTIRNLEEHSLLPLKNILAKYLLIARRQFIGQTDKNGIMIFEGDIHRSEDPTEEGDLRDYYACTWINEWSMFAWLHLPGEYYDYLDNGSSNLDEPLFWTYPVTKDEASKIIICGNIYENPDLVQTGVHETER
jgi:hypothetical protein